MNLLDDSIFVHDVVDTEASDGLGEEDKDLLETLERMAAEIDSENWQFQLRRPPRKEFLGGWWFEES